MALSVSGINVCFRRDVHHAFSTFFGNVYLWTYLPPGYKRSKHGEYASFRRKPFDRVTSLHLTDKPDTQKQIDP